MPGKRDAGDERADCSYHASCSRFNESFRQEERGSNGYPQLRVRQEEMFNDKKGHRKPTKVLLR